MLIGFNDVLEKSDLIKMSVLHLVRNSGKKILLLLDLHW
jgi:hypothetical protein